MQIASSHEFGIIIEVTWCLCSFSPFVCRSLSPGSTNRRGISSQNRMSDQIGIPCQDGAVVAQRKVDPGRLTNAIFSPSLVHCNQLALLFLSRGEFCKELTIYALVSLSGLRSNTRCLTNFWRISRRLVTSPPITTHPKRVRETGEGFE